MGDQWDKVKGKAKVVVGEATNNESMEAEGHIQEKTAEAKQTIKDTAEDVKENVAEKFNDAVDKDK